MEDEDARAAPHAPPRRVDKATHIEVLQKLIVRRAEPEPFSVQDMAPAEFDLPDPTTDATANVQSFDRLAATALGRTADRLYGLPMIITGVEMNSSTPAELAELFPDRALLAIVQGHADHLGVVALCPSLIASLIEMQAIGRVSGRPVRPRKPTRTDAAISADFVNALLRELHATQQSGDELPDFASFSYVSFLDDIRPLMLMLEDVPLATLTLRFRIGTGGLRDGELIVALPQARLAQIGTAELGMIGHSFDLGEPTTYPDSHEESPELSAPTSDMAPHSDDPQGSGTEAGFMRHQVQASPLTLVGVLCRRDMTLRALRALSAGDVIPLAAGVLAQARIETTDGQLLAIGKLGEAEGQYAIRLHGAHPGQGGAGLSADDALTFAPQLRPSLDHDVDAMTTDDSAPPSEIDMEEPDEFRSRPLPVLDTSFENDEDADIMDLSALANF